METDQASPNKKSKKAKPQNSTDKSPSYGEVGQRIMAIGKEGLPLRITTTHTKMELVGGRPRTVSYAREDWGLVIVENFGVFNL